MMKCRRFLSSAFFICIVFISFESELEACTILAVGKNATKDGSSLVAHTDDAGGGTVDLRLIRVPSMDHKPGSMRAVYEFVDKYPRVVTYERGELYEPVDGQKLSIPLGHIPQVAHTFAYFDQDYGMINEVQLSIAESTCSAKTAGFPKSVPNGLNMFGITELTKVTMERCDSARCAIKLMGKLGVEYGYYGPAEALGITDRYGEVWIFHILTGPNNASAVWAAQRVPDSHITIVPNAFIIRELNLTDSDNYMASDNVIDFAKEMGWYKPNKGPFDFTAAYVGVGTSPFGALAAGRRIWRFYDIFAPSNKFDSRLGHIATKPTYPFSVKPDYLIQVPQLMTVMRDYYEGTDYDLTKGIAAGPFGSPVRYVGPNHNLSGGWERAISVYRAAFSFVLQVRGNLPNEIAGLIWYGQDAPHGTVYVPFYSSQGKIPRSYLVGKQSEFNLESAWWAFNFVNNWSQMRFNVIHQDIVAKYKVYEDEAFQLQRTIEAKVLEMHHNRNAETVVEYIQSETNRFANYVVEGWWKFAWQLVSRYHNGDIVTGDDPKDMITPGYDRNWLEVTEYSKYPGNSFTPPQGISYTGLKPPTNAKSSYILIACVGASILLAGIIGCSIWCHKREKRRGYINL